MSRSAASFALPNSNRTRLSSILSPEALNSVSSRNGARGIPLMPCAFNNSGRLLPLAETFAVTAGFAAARSTVPSKPNSAWLIFRSVAERSIAESARRTLRATSNGRAGTPSEPSPCSGSVRSGPLARSVAFSDGVARPRSSGPSKPSCD